MENGDVVELAEIESPNRVLGERTDPYMRFFLSWDFEEQRGPHTVVVDWLVCVELTNTSKGITSGMRWNKVSSQLASNVVLFWE